MYLISFLHQTTTVQNNICVTSNCILSLFYIKPQLLPALSFKLLNCILSLFYIKPQRVAVQGQGFFNCILSLFYIKPQPIQDENGNAVDCILSLFYIKPQHVIRRQRCQHIVSYLFSTSNHNQLSYYAQDPQIVSYLFSTSNHNNLKNWQTQQDIVSYLFSTSNHNCAVVGMNSSLLYLISFLHQTTTNVSPHFEEVKLYLISFLHQTTTTSTGHQTGCNCILSLFYIKPQRMTNARCI